MANRKGRTVKSHEKTWRVSKADIRNAIQKLSHKKSTNSMMSNKLIELEKRMINLFEQLLPEDGHCKSGEPALTITINNDLTWSAEIYSYTVDYPCESGSGRHFYFEADSFDKLIRKIEKAISEVEQAVQNGMYNRKHTKSFWEDFFGIGIF